jgi:hypothetical protein
MSTTETLAVWIILLGVGGALPLFWKVFFPWAALRKQTWTLRLVEGMTKTVGSELPKKASYFRRIGDQHMARVCYEHLVSDFVFECVRIRLRSVRRLLISRLQQATVMNPPASWLVSLAEIACRPKTQNLIAQSVADMRTDYFDALKAKRTGRARWLLGLHYVAIFRALFVTRPFESAVTFVWGIVSKAGK